MLRLPAKVDRYELPAGYAGTLATVDLMARKVRERVAHPRMRRRALEVFAGLRSLDFAAELEALWAFMLANVRYQRDPVGIEHITDPVELDEQIDEGVAAEDCESIALYAATVLAAAGIPSEFEIQGRDPSRPQSFRHAALVVVNPRTGERTSFDPVGAYELGEDQFSLGDTLHRDGDPVERFGLDGRKRAMSTYLESCDRLLGDCGSCDHRCGMSGIEDVVRTVAHATEEYAPAFGIIGTAVGGVVKVGETLYDEKTGKKIGNVAVTSSPMTVARELKPGPSPKQLQAAAKASREAQKQQPSSVGTVAAVAGGGLLLAKVLGIF